MFKTKVKKNPQQSIQEHLQHTANSPTSGHHRGTEVGVR